MKSFSEKKWSRSFEAEKRFSVEKKIPKKIGELMRVTFNAQLQIAVYPYKN